MVIRLGSLENKEQQIVHSPFHGERIMGKEAINARVRTTNGVWKEVELYSYSPFGIEFVNSELKLNQGDAIDVKIKMVNDETDFSGLVVNSVHENENLKLAGVRTFIKDKPNETYLGSERREHRRWSCSEDFLPTGTAPNPVRYNDYILFRVDDISSSGMKLITSMRNKFIGMGQRLETTLSMPYVGTVRADIRVKHVNTTFYRGKEFMVLGVEFVKKDPILLRSLGEYLLNFAKEVTVKSLNIEGFGLKSVSKWLDFSYVKTEEEYKEVLELRYNAYKEANKISVDDSVNKMSDDYDKNAKILIAKHNGKVVGSMRLIFPSSKNEMELQKSIDYPKNFPEIINTVETSRFCTNSDFRGIDIAYGLVSHMVLATITNNRRYLYTAATDKSWLKICKKLGWKLTKIDFTDKNIFMGQAYKLMIMDTYALALGRGIGPKYWNMVYRNLSEYIITKNVINYNTIDRIRLHIYRTIGNILY